jgi:hypothetical protein
LLRENILRNALSDLRARSTGIYHHQHDNEEQRSGLSKLNVDTNELQQKMNAIVRQNKKLASIISDMDHIKIRYEDFNDWDKTMNRIAAFLNVSTTAITAGAKKLNPDNLQDMIANYDEVENWLKQNNYAEFVV